MRKLEISHGGAESAEGAVESVLFVKKMLVNYERIPFDLFDLW